MVARLGVAMVARRGSVTSGSEEGHQMGNETWWSAQVALRVLGVCSPVLGCSAADGCTFVFSVTHAAVTC